MCESIFSERLELVQMNAAFLRAAVAKWPEFAGQAKMREEWRKQIQRHLRLDLLALLTAKFRIRQ